MPTEIIAEADKQEFFIVRDFDAPRELVFAAYANPHAYAQWISPQEVTTTLQQAHPEGIGKWQFIQKDKRGNEHIFWGVNHEVRFPELIITTFEIDGLQEAGHAALETIRFESLSENKTKVVDHCVFQTVQDRDDLLQAGVEQGIVDSHYRLDELLAKELRKKVGVVGAVRKIFANFY